MPVESLSDHELFLALKCQDSEAWRHVWDRVVLVECGVRRNAEMIRKWGVAPEEVMSILYSEMIGHDKISGYRDDGGNLIGWLRKYVRGYIYRSSPENSRIELSESVPDIAVANEGDVSEKREDWEIVQRCFSRLWAENPLRAYVHLLKLRDGMSSAEIRSLLNVNFWTAILTAAAQAGGNPSKGPVADQSADDAPVQVRRGRTLVCASEALRKEAQDWSRKLASQATNDVRVLLCDSMCQDKDLCGKRTFRHLGAFRREQTKR